MVKKLHNRMTVNNQKIKTTMKEMKAFTKNSFTKIIQTITAATKALPKLAHEAINNLIDAIADFIEEVQDSPMEKRMPDENQTAVLLAPVCFINIITFIVVVVATITVKLITKSSWSASIYNIAILGLALPATFGMLHFKLHNIIPIPKEFLNLYKSLPFSGLKKNSCDIYVWQRKLFGMIRTTGIMTIIFHIISPIEVNVSFNLIYMPLAFIITKMWDIEIAVMCIDGIYILVTGMIALKTYMAEREKPRRVAKGNILSHLQKKLTLKQTHKPSRLAKGNTSIKERILSGKY